MSPSISVIACLLLLTTCMYGQEAEVSPPTLVRGCLQKRMRTTARLEVASLYRKQRRACFQLCANIQILCYRLARADETKIDPDVQRVLFKCDSNYMGYRKMCFT